MPNSSISGIRLYGIRSCDTCRRARKFLDSRNIEFQFHDLREDGLDIQMLERWADRIGYEKLLNRQSLTWRKIPEVDRADMVRNKALAAMIEQPTLIKRPVFEAADFMAVGFSEQRFDDYLNRIK